MHSSLDESLLALQFGDSAFPSGGFTFSWGLEGLMADGLATSRTDIAEIAVEQLSSRWAPTDRVFLARAYRAYDESELIEIDRLAEAWTGSQAIRAGSRRAGRRLLGTAAGLHFEDSASYHRRCRVDEASGHLAIAQGLVFREAGMALRTALLVSGWATLSGLVSAAVKLGLVGHREAQEILTETRPVLGRLASAPIEPDADPWSFTPLLDIAVARSDGRANRLFAT